MSSQEEQELEAAISFWKEFNVNQQKDELELVCLEVKNLKTSAIARKTKLIEETKQFKSQTKEVQIETFPNLLKIYQEEIDLISKRAKYCETSYYNIYKQINNAIDPVPIIESLLQTIHNLSNTNNNSNTYILTIEKLKNEILQYETEFLTLKNQDITIRRLEETLNDYKNNNEIKINEEVNKRIIDLEQESEKKMISVLELQKNAEKRVLLTQVSMIYIVYMIRILYNCIHYSNVYIMLLYMVPYSITLIILIIYSNVGKS